MLWIGVVLIGAYHGLNPAMGWPLAVANGLTERRGAAVGATLASLGLGHLLAVLLVLVPFSVLTGLLEWNREIRLAAGALVVVFGLSRLVWRRHPRWLMRVRPSRLVLWSLLMATAHGAALMLLPVLIGLCQAPAAATMTPAAGPVDHQAVMTLMRAGVETAVVVCLLHSAAMIASGLAAAWVVYRYVGLRVLQYAWLDLNALWALSLIVSGAAALASSLPGSGMWGH